MSVEHVELFQCLIFTERTMNDLIIKSGDEHGFGLLHFFAKIMKISILDGKTIQSSHTKPKINKPVWRELQRHFFVK